jgi:hypothetical protein
MSQTQTEARYLSDWLKWEEDNLFSRENIVLLGGSGDDLDLKTGLVLGKLTSGGKWVPLTEGPSDGSQTPAGILLLDTLVPDGVDTEAVAIARDAIVNWDCVEWPATYDQTNKDAAIVILKGLGIVLREGA